MPSLPGAAMTVNKVRAGLGRTRAYRSGEEGERRSRRTEVCRFLDTGGLNSSDEKFTSLRGFSLGVNFLEKSEGRRERELAKQCNAEKKFQSVGAAAKKSQGGGRKLRK